MAWALLYHRFNQIHVLADRYARGCVLQAILITWYGVIKNCLDGVVGSQSRKSMATVLFAVVVVGYPLIPVISGRGWMQFEMFALAPDPTVLATLAILLVYNAPKILYVIPVIWVILSGMTLFVMW